MHVGLVEPPAEVAGRGRIGDALRPEGIEVNLVVAPQFQIVQARAAAQTVVSDVQHVIGLVVRQMLLEQMQAAVDPLDQAGPQRQAVHQPDAALAQSPLFGRQFVVNVGCAEHRPGLFRPLPIAQPPGDPTLALGQNPCSTSAHSKCLLAGQRGRRRAGVLTLQNTAFRVFYCKNGLDFTLDQGLEAR
ncbi:MAG: hypothetical protein HS102_05580 [Planctomycetia bacterium]|nr:hypothetical protein [Planctomycetia bacterium]